MFLASDRLLQMARHRRHCRSRLIGDLLGRAARGPRVGNWHPRLVWTQSVTRTRWFAVKLGLVGLASMAVTGVFSLMVTWWASPLDRVN